MRKKAFNIFTIFLRGAPKLKNRCVFEKFPFFKYSEDSNEPKNTEWFRPDPIRGSVEIWDKNARRYILRKNKFKPPFWNSNSSHFFENLCEIPKMDGNERWIPILDPWFFVSEYHAVSTKTTFQFKILNKLRTEFDCTIKWIADNNSDFSAFNGFGNKIIRLILCENILLHCGVFMH